LLFYIPSGAWSVNKDHMLPFSGFSTAGAGERVLFDGDSAAHPTPGMIMIPAGAVGF
jgi:hypothetical protein